MRVSSNRTSTASESPTRPESMHAPHLSLLMLYVCVHGTLHTRPTRHCIALYTHQTASRGMRIGTCRSMCMHSGGRFHPWRDVMMNFSFLFSFLFSFFFFSFFFFLFSFFFFLFSFFFFLFSFFFFLFSFFFFSFLSFFSLFFFFKYQVSTYRYNNSFFYSFMYILLSLPTSILLYSLLYSPQCQCPVFHIPVCQV